MEAEINKSLKDSFCHDPKVSLNILPFVYRTAHTKLVMTTKGAWTTIPWQRPNTRSSTGRGRSVEGSMIAGTDIRRLAGDNSFSYKL